MDKQNRKAIIAGNWKMNKTATEAAELIDALIPAVKDAGCEVVICVPFTDLVTAVAKTKGTNIHVGAENVHFEKSGAFTGEISVDMLTDLGVALCDIKQFWNTAKVGCQIGRPLSWARTIREYSIGLSL